MATCKTCDDDIVVDCGYETPTHGYCVECASDLLNEILKRELPPEYRYMRPVISKTVHGIYVDAAPLGSVKTELARAYASELLRACDEADQGR